MQIADLQDVIEAQQRGWVKASSQIGAIPFYVADLRVSCNNKILCDWICKNRPDSHKN